MRRRVTAAALLLAMVVLAGCNSARTEKPTDVTVDPSEAFYPQDIVMLNQTATWGGFKLKVEKAEAMVHKNIRDIDLTVYVVYTNLGSQDLSQPEEAAFEFGGRAYPADPPGQIEIPGPRFVEGPVPAGVTAKGTIRGTLTDVAKSDPPSRDEMHDILVNTRLVIGSGTNQAVFPFTER